MPGTPRPGRPRLRVVIVNYRVGAMAVDALASLEPQVVALPGTRVTVVDNASGDDSVDVLRDAIAARGWGAWCDLVAHPVNGGFAAGNNVAFRRALAEAEPPDAFLLMNPDARAEPRCLEVLLDHLAARPEIALGGVRVLDEDGELRRSAFRFLSIPGELNTWARWGLASKLLSRWVVAPPVPEGVGEVDWVSGAGFFVRRAVLDDIGLMDEGFFLYFEETDFCFRAKEAGHRCWYVPDARIVHVGGQSTGVTGKANAERRRRPAYWFRSRRRYFLKRGGAPYALLADAAVLSGLALWGAKRVMTRSPDLDPEGFLGDFVRHTVQGPLTVGDSDHRDPETRR